MRQWHTRVSMKITFFFFFKSSLNIQYAPSQEICSLYSRWFHVAFKTFIPFSKKKHIFLSFLFNKFHEFVSQKISSIMFWEIAPHDSLQLKLTLPDQINLKLLLKKIL